MISALIILIACALVCLAMAVVPRRAAGLERRVLRKLRLISQEKCDRPVGRAAAVATRIIGICALGALTALGAFLSVMRIETAPFDPATISRSSRHTVQIGSRPALPFGDAVETSITKTIAPVMKSGECVGIVVGVIQGDRAEVFSFGRKQLSGNAAPDGKTLFEIGSITKVFTASALSSMVESGQLKLDAPIQDLLPESVKVPEFSGRKITCLDLVTQTSGLPRIPDNIMSLKDWVTLRFLVNPYANYSQERLFRYLNGATLKRAPGSKYEYSNLGMGLLGFALSHKRGQSYEEFVKELICKPLGMNDTMITLKPEERSRLATGYCVCERDGDNLVGISLGPWDLPDTVAGAGALRSTADDLIKFMAANLDITSGTLNASLAKTHASRFKVDAQTEIGMGWHLVPEVKGLEGPVIWHNGGTGGYRSLMALHKPTRTGVVILSNTAAEIDAQGFIILTMLATANRPQH